MARVTTKALNSTHTVSTNRRRSKYTRATTDGRDFDTAPKKAKKVKKPNKGKRVSYTKNGKRVTYYVEDRRAFWTDDTPEHMHPAPSAVIEHETRRYKKPTLPGVFDHFGLPRELRDKVSSYLHEDMQTGVRPEDPTHAVTFFVRLPLPHVRLVNHQMKREYDERPRSGHVRLHCGQAVTRINPPSCATRSTKVSLVMPLPYFGMSLRSVEHLDIHCHMLPRVLPRIQTMDIVLQIPMGLDLRKIFDGDFPAWTGELTRFRHVQRVRFVPHDAALWHTILAEWLPVEGLQVHAETIRQVLGQMEPKGRSKHGYRNAGVFGSGQPEEDAGKPIRGRRVLPWVEPAEAA